MLKDGEPIRCACCRHAAARITDQGIVITQRHDGVKHESLLTFDSLFTLAAMRNASPAVRRNVLKAVAERNDDEGSAESEEKPLTTDEEHATIAGDQIAHV